MGLRFRKSIKLAPGVKFNLNKKSSSITFGKKGVHYTINSKGKKTVSVGLPGTGISYSVSNNKHHNKGEKNTHSPITYKKTKTPVIIFLAVFLIFLLFIINNKKNENNISNFTDMEILKIENHPIFYGDFTVAKEIWSEYPNVAVVNARQTISNEDALLLITTGDSDNNYITSIVINFRNSTENVNYSFDDMLSLTCEYLPFDILDKYYTFSNSFKEVTSDNTTDSFYYIYELNSDGINYNAQNNSLHLNNKFAFKIIHHLETNKWTIKINYLSSEGNTDKYSAGYFLKEEWSVNLDSYR